MLSHILKTRVLFFFFFLLKKEREKLGLVPESPCECHSYPCVGSRALLLLPAELVEVRTLFIWANRCQYISRAHICQFCYALTPCRPPPYSTNFGSKALGRNMNEPWSSLRRACGHRSEVSKRKLREARRVVEFGLLSSEILVYCVFVSRILCDIWYLWRSWIV